MSREMKSYVVNTKFSVGVDDTSVIEFEKGQEIAFDGKTAVINGQEEPLPKLQVAIRSQWLREAGTADTFRPSSAKIRMSGATPEQDEVIADGNASLMGDERAVLSVADRQNLTPEPTTPPTTEVEGQEVVPIGRKFNNSAKTSVDISKLSSQDFHKTVAEMEKPIQTDGEVITEEEAAEATSDRRTSEGISFDNLNVGERAAAGKVARGDKYNAANPNRPENQIVGSVSKRGAEAKVKGESKVVEASATEPSAPVEVEKDDDLDVKTREGRYAVARTIHPDLPEWDFSAHWRTKMSTLKENLSENQLAIRAIYASESEALKKRIKTEFNLD